MTASRFTKIAAAAIAGVTLMTTAASALDARATTPVNVRSGPGTGYHVVDVLSRGERVNVETCRSNGWCHISHRGADGWVSSRYLSQSKPTYSKRPTHRSNSDEFMMRFGGSNFSFSIGTGSKRRPSRPQVQQHIHQHYHQHDHYYNNGGNGGGYNGCYEHNGYTVCE